MSAQRVPLNFFAMPFGIAGLAEVWLTASQHGRAPVAVANTLAALAALLWLGIVLAYGRYALAEKGALRRDLQDLTAGPFAALILITPMMLSYESLAPYAHTAGKVVIDVFLVLVLLLGGWFTGQWIYGPLDVDRLHPGYFLPTVAGGLIASASATSVGQVRLGQIMLGLGLVCWLILGSMILARLVFRPPLPPALQPTLAIEVAPPAVASLAWFTLYGGRPGLVTAALAGYGLLMVLAQIRLLPMFLRLSFAPSFWAFTFSWAAVAAVAVQWSEADHPAGHVVYTYLLLAAITLLIGGVAVRTLMAALRGELLPKPPAESAVLPDRPLAPQVH